MDSETEVGQLIESARGYASSDAAASIWKSGLAGEMIANLIGARAGLPRQRAHTQETYLYDLEQAGIIPAAAARDFHKLRMMRNDATHQHLGSRAEAQRALGLASGLQALLGARAGASPARPPQPAILTYRAAPSPPAPPPPAPRAAAFEPTYAPAAPPLRQTYVAPASRQQESDARATYYRLWGWSSRPCSSSAC